MLQDYDPDDLQVRVAELMVATADESDAHLDGCIHDVLKLLRAKMKMDVVFVSEFTGGQRVFRQVEQGPEALLAEGAGDPIEESWCQRVVDGRLPEFIADAKPLQAAGVAPATPFSIGTHISTPVKLPNGELYGTLCCFSFAPEGDASEADLRKLRYTAELTGQRLQASRQRALDALSLQPLAEGRLKRPS
ncbi:GAF domain-containing protein [Caenimonas sedimenti]|uniref:GAF domain-containing protein n=1 Tax=Caenimonas sedimenti TaxID=2596921 RepID=UPI001646FE75|nr:GAF domain-containing protein [Caenimonas sedimenti]